MSEFLVDLSVLVERLRGELRKELISELRGELGNRWPEYMTIETAAGYLDVTVARIRKLIARSEVPYCQEAAGCRVFFRRRDLDDWMASLRHPARGDGA